MTLYSVLDRKLFRELSRLRGQVMAIALVVAGGVAVCMISLVNYASLSETRTDYYRQYGFADVFVELTRAPKHLLPALAQLEGIAKVEARVQSGLRLKVPGYSDPVSGRVVSLPDQGEPGLHRLFLRAGRLPDARYDDEVAVNGGFAEAHGLGPGDRVDAIIQGRWQSLRIVGVVESPEFIYVIAPGSMLPDYHRFGVFWMRERALAAVTDMEGAFNSLLISLQPGVSAAAVIEALDARLGRYGSVGAYDRRDHPSDRFLSEELDQLRTMAWIFPAIFMSVAIFLINVVVGRLVATERDVIAVLKAFGYSNLQVSVHFAKMVSLIMWLGSFLGIAAGLWAAHVLTALYMDYFRFPSLLFEVPPGATVLVVVLAWLAGLLGARGALTRAFRLSPAAAMGPEPAPLYRRTRMEQWFGRWIRFTQPTRIIFRSIERRPWRAIMSVLGVAMATAIIILGTFQFDAIKLIVHSQFVRVQQEDMTVSLVHPRTVVAAQELMALLGVRTVETSLVVPVRLRAGHLSWRVGLVGLSPQARLSQRVDVNLAPLPLPDDGLMLSDFLMGELQLRPGDPVTLEWLDGRAPDTEVRVVAGTREFVGVGAWMSLPALQRLRGRGAEVNQLQVTVDPEARAAVLAELEERPLVAGVTERSAMLNAFYENVGTSFLTYTAFVAVLGGVIAFGVIYNTVRISLAERGRELASLRVLGYRPAEVDHILLGELALLLLPGIPLGWVIGYQLSWLLIRLMESELFRIPLMLSGHTLGLSASVVIVSAILSGMVAVRRVATLDLIAVLKTRE